ncbi:MAG: acetyl-CoA carboxylase biotin carboxyl carrier protein [Alphaproteobacteria bacterium]
MGKPDLDEKLLKKLVKALDDYDLTEIEVGEGRHRLRISRARMAAAAPAAPAPAATAAQPAAAAPAGDDAAKAHPGAVNSPMVGTVYIAPEPGAGPFVKVGDTVKAGDTLLLIEAMKTMNPIRAPRPGKITQILVTNAAPVEYGEVLLIIE